MIGKTLDPVIASAVLAFGFVYIHPFEDGNGRLHRYIFHHVLAEHGFNPPGVVFPISTAILERIDDYRFFDATPHAVFLYSCVQKAIEIDLRYETEFLRRYDQFRAAIDDMFDMPARTVDLLFRFIQQNNGQLSARARGKEFAALTDHEVERVESIYSDFNAP